jgi:hypothetical protein
MLTIPDVFKRAPHVVTASVTKEIKRDTMYHEREGEGEARRKGQLETQVNRTGLGQIQPNRPEPRQTEETGSSQEKMTQNDEGKRDNGSASVIPEGRAALTGKLCQRVMALIRWQCGIDGAVDDRMVRTLEGWLRRRGISIYTDLV